MPGHANSYIPSHGREPGNLHPGGLIKPISRKLTISIKDEEKGTELGSLTAEFDLPTDYEEVYNNFETPVLVAPRVNDVKFQSNISRALTAAADKLGE